MKLVKSYWREGLLAIFSVTFVTLVYYWTAERPGGTVAQSLLLIGIAASAIGCVLLVRSLWRAKWKKAAMAGMQRIFAKIQRFLEKFSGKPGLGKGKKSVLSGRTTVVFDRVSDREDGPSAKPKKPPKWKQLQSDRERMRFLYGRMLSEKLKRGTRIYATDTPSEVSGKLEREQEKTPAERELLEIYIGLRYDERRQPDGEAVKRLKKELDIK